MLLSIQELWTEIFVVASHGASINGRSDPSHGHEQDHIKCGAVTVFLSLPHRGHRTITAFTSAETADISPALYGAKLAKVLGECRLLGPLSEKIDQPTELQLVTDVGTRFLKLQDSFQWPGCLQTSPSSNAIIFRAVCPCTICLLHVLGAGFDFAELSPY